MNKSPFKFLAACILGGIAVGSVIGFLGLSGLISKPFFDFLSAAVIKLCIGIIVLIIDLLCIWGLFKPKLDRYIDKNGESVVGVIEDVREIPRPDQLNADEWTKKVRYACVISYKAGSREYKKEFPPTHLTSKQELYPFSLEVGNEISIKYLKKFPSLSQIDAEQLKTGREKESKNDIIHLIMIPLLVTTIYLAAVILF